MKRPKNALVRFALSELAKLGIKGVDVIYGRHAKVRWEHEGQSHTMTVSGSPSARSDGPVRQEIHRRMKGAYLKR